MFKNPNLLILIGQRARFANQNLGWFELGDKIEDVRGTRIYKFKRMVYRPSLEDAEKFFHSRDFAWNPGYFVTTPRFILSQYKKFAPEMWKAFMQIQEEVGHESFEKTLEKIYPSLEKISFDDAILEKVDPKYISVIAADLGWSDIGAWEALKEALEVSSSENVTRKVLINDSSDNLIFNQTDQLVVGLICLNDRNQYG